MSVEQPNQPTPESFQSPTPEIDSAPKSATPETVAAEINALPTPKVAVKSDGKSVATSTQGSFLEKVGLLWQSIVKLSIDFARIPQSEAIRANFERSNSSNCDRDRRFNSEYFIGKTSG